MLKFALVKSTLPVELVLLVSKSVEPSFKSTFAVLLVAETFSVVS